MCGRFSLFTVASVLAERFDIRVEGKLTPRYNIAPTQEIAVILNTAPHSLTMVKWGLIPTWAKDDSFKTINAKQETVAEKPMFKRLVNKKRCLILADGFYEWHHVGEKKIPYRAYFMDNVPFAMAGLYDHWVHEGVELITATIMTTAAAGKLADIHTRMPVILDQTSEKKWLSDVPYGELHLTNRTDLMLKEIPPLINSPRNEKKAVLG